MASPRWPLSATPVGMKAVCETELTQIDRRKLTFAVNVYDEAGKIAEGTHERFVVDSEKFMAKAAAKQWMSRSEQRMISLQSGYVAVDRNTGCWKILF